MRSLLVYYCCVGRTTTRSTRSVLTVVPRVQLGGTLLLRLPLKYENMMVEDIAMFGRWREQRKCVASGRTGCRILVSRIAAIDGLTRLGTSGDENEYVGAECNLTSAIKNTKPHGHGHNELGEKGGQDSWLPWQVTAGVDKKSSWRQTYKGDTVSPYQQGQCPATLWCSW